MLRNSSQHSRSDFFPIMKGEDEAGRSSLAQDAMRPSLALYRPVDAQQRRQNPASPGRRPVVSCIGEGYRNVEGLGFTMFEAVGDGAQRNDFGAAHGFIARDA